MHRRSLAFGGYHRVNYSHPTERFKRGCLQTVGTGATIPSGREAHAPLQPQRVRRERCGVRRSLQAYSCAWPLSTRNCCFASS